MSTSRLEAEFFDSTRDLSQLEITWLCRQGVPHEALWRDPGDTGFVLGTANVFFDGELFDFAGADHESPLPALVVIARGGDGEPLDLVAWSNKARRIGALYGRAGLLGEQNLWAPRLIDAPAIHRDPLDWLRASRDGCVIVRPTRAARILLDSPGRLAVADEAHARDLAKLLSSTVDLSRIVMPATRKAAA